MINAFNLEAQESPTGAAQLPVTEKETREAIVTFATEKPVPAAVRVQLGEILRTGMLPSNVYFRRFTRFDDGDELKLVNYIPDGDRKPPETLNPVPSITGHIEPLANGTHLVTDIITNPGSLLSAQLANKDYGLGMYSSV